MSFLSDVKLIVSRYKARDIFSYTGVSKFRIIKQLILLILASLTKVRYVTAKVNDYRMKLDLKTPGLSRVLFVYGTRELPDTYLMQKILKPGMVVADIGANIGYYALMEASRVGESGHVHAFEPDPRNIKLLRENVILNKFEDRITVYQKAVSHKNETRKFQLGERTNVSGFIDRDDVVGSAEIDTVAISDFEHLNKVTVVRMDLEGYECVIIKDLLPNLREHNRPFHILLEVHQNVYNDTDLNFDALLQDLFSINFKVANIIAGTHQREYYLSLGYTSVGTWFETKHGRDLYENIDDEHVRQAVKEGKVRAMLISRD